MPDVAVFDVPEPHCDPAEDALFEPDAVLVVELCELPPADPLDDPEPDEPPEEFGPQPRPTMGTAATAMVKQMRRAD